MGDAENVNATPKMDRSNSNDDQDKETVEKKLKVDEQVLGLEGKTENAALPSSKEESQQGKDGSSNSKPMNVPSEECTSSSSASTNEAAASSSSMKVEEKPPEEEGVEEELKVVFKKESLKISMSLDKTVGDLKKLIEGKTGVTPELQKVLIKGIAKDTQTLRSLGVTKSTKILVIGSSLDEVMAVAQRPDKTALAVEEAIAAKESTNWCSLPQHKKVIDKGVPDNVMPGLLNENEPLPDIPLFGMLSSKGAQVRLTFKLEADELWIGTKERTEKIAINTIRSVTSQAIPGYEHYHIMAIQLGPTDASRFFVYWVPAQYVASIKDALDS